MPCISCNRFNRDIIKINKNTIKTIEISDSVYKKIKDQLEDAKEIFSYEDLIVR